jgi:hypothetical protein
MEIQLFRIYENIEAVAEECTKVCEAVWELSRRLQGALQATSAELGDDIEHATLLVSLESFEGRRVLKISGAFGDGLDLCRCIQQGSGYRPTSQLTFMVLAIPIRHGWRGRILASIACTHGCDAFENLMRSA